MANVIVHAPSSGNMSITVNGRTYKGTPGTPLTVPDFDAQVMCANGWSLGSANIGVATGPTSGRPVNPPVNTHYQDTTVGYEILWDGKTWRHTQTGASS
jgi:chaperone required for assembly of F1-ATPase